MKFRIEKTDLMRALSVVRNSLSNSNDISSHYVFRYRPDNGLEVLSFSGRVFSSAPLRVGVEPAEAQAFTIEGARLNGVLGVLKDVLLDFEFDPKTKNTTMDWGDSAVFRSLDPSEFPYWDRLLEDSATACHINAQNLANGLSYSKMFTATGEMETRKPELCVVQVKDGKLFSTDMANVSTVTIPDLDGDWRIHQSDVNSVVKFLKTFEKDQTVQVDEHLKDGKSRAVLFQRGDGAVFGVSRPMGIYPQLSIPHEGDDPVMWAFEKPALDRVLRLLAVQAGDSDDNVVFDWNPSNEDAVNVGRVNYATGNKKSYQCPIEVALTTDTDPISFKVSSADLQKVLGAWQGENVIMGIHVKGDRGFVRYRQDREGYSTLTISAWLK